MNKTQESELQNQVEALIDRDGLNSVLSALAQVCWEKAEHIRTNWQDDIAAKEWDRVGKALDKQSEQFLRI